MHLVVVSDLHGDLGAVNRACDRYRPDVLLSCGDWGDPEQVAEPALAALLLRVPVYTTFGNHDPMETLARLKNQDGSPILLGQGEVREVGGLRLAAIGGIWAKSHAKPHYVTDADVAEWAATIARAGPVDILLTHACPIGLADLTPTGRHGGQRSFLDAFNTIKPRLHLCGHLHVAQERSLKDGRKVVNVGATPDGCVVTLDFDAGRKRLEAKLERMPSL
jgi:uncharacterized protein